MMFTNPPEIQFTLLYYLFQLYSVHCNVPLMKCNFGSLLERVLHFQRQKSQIYLIKSTHVRFTFRTTLTRHLCHKVLNRTSQTICLVQCFAFHCSCFSNQTFLSWIVSVVQQAGTIKALTFYSAWRCDVECESATVLTSTAVTNL